MEVKRVSRAGRPRRDERGLDVERITTEAWAIVNREGVAALSTRALAAALNVKSPALYWHVKSKEELFALMMEHLLRHSFDGVDENLPWKQWLHDMAMRQHGLLLSNRDSGIIATLAPPSDRVREEVFPRLMGPLLQQGFAPRVASAAAGGLISLVLGWVIYEQRPETYAFMASYHEPAYGFAFALDSYVKGIAVNY
ncbi:TetR family transcriptional regulator [Novosphingobium sp. FSY-8]|uniref:TetR family transcriptional regulator n=1 Tax=Novosphingobium ovatum TaxID=1908523 RepID=A0ABW9XA64_9SPHN|nr:TetR family transcriptional regulator [Novosphingobium ovatum]NBC35425.1 TetR family transcriptional regulator [Novosphingobium ovatum]